MTDSDISRTVNSVLFGKTRNFSTKRTPNELLFGRPRHIRTNRLPRMVIAVHVLSKILIQNEMLQRS